MVVQEFFAGRNRFWGKNQRQIGMTMKDRPFKYRFDFEIGYLVKSPCKTCNLQNTFPKCAATCHLLDEIQTILAEAVSLTRS